jgi:hypothetical protein
MPDVIPQRGAEYNQESFIGGMNLLGDDSRLATNQYKAGFNLTNRYDVLDGVLESQEDTAVPSGIKQEMVTFGLFEIIFVAGYAYYKFYTDTGWTKIDNFKMSVEAPRYWTVAVPIATTNYVRLSIATSNSDTSTNAAAGIIQRNVAGAFGGNLPGLLVQDNISQPMFIFLDATTSKPIARTTQTYAQWSITYTDATNVTIAPSGDKREYVPVGNAMTWEDGVLYITSQDGNFIYRSVSGRPLDFVINVVNTLATNAPFVQTGGGDATTTSYSVGVGGITTLRPLSSGGIFVAASNANFAVTKNMSNNAPKIFGEYTFIRTFLFNANCITDRGIIDTIGDTRFIDLTGVRSFNAVAQTQNEGRNTPFTAAIQPAFVKGSGSNFALTITQDPANVAAILFDNYELYAMQTVFGPAICKYDTVNSCWTSFDVSQVDGKRIKIFSKIELAILRLYAVTEDDRLFNLYIGPQQIPATFRTVGICATILYASQSVRMNNPKNEVKLQSARVILNKIIEDCTCSFTPYVNNRLSSVGKITKNITYKTPAIVSTDPLDLPDVNTQMENLLYTVPNCEQGWKVFGIFTWTGGSFTQFSMMLDNLTPMNPPNTQSNTQ